MDQFSIYGIRFSEFNLNERQFNHLSRLHGILHTYRVMIHVLRLGLASGKTAEARLAFFAAYIHDMARTHDGYCTRHGADSANTKLPLYRDLFIENGAGLSDLLIIGKTVTMHSLGTELNRDDPDWFTIALLKDADALDRIRLGEDDLNPAYLRLPETHACIGYARNLFYKTDSGVFPDFTGMLNTADQLK